MAPTEPFLITPQVHRDERGFFLETRRLSVLEHEGIDHPFLQANHSRSIRGAIRGLHAQPGQAKLVRCARGSILDAVVDVRPGSPSFGRPQTFILDDDRHQALYVPDGFAHGFAVLSNEADVVYECSSYYDPATEIAIAHDDPAIGISWPVSNRSLSVRDRTARPLSDVADELAAFNVRG